jgi:hypothetical protein
LGLATLIRRGVHLTPGFSHTAPMAEARFTYTWENDRVEVACQLRLFQNGSSKVFIMNELGADFFRASWQEGQLAPPPSGWQALPLRLPTPSLYDAGRGLRFSLSALTVAEQVPVRLFWGRERNADCCWAGFELEFGAMAAAEAVLSFQYTVQFDH